MTDNDIHIEQLIIERLTGVISEEDSFYLDGLLNTDEGVRSQLEKAREKLEGSSLVNPGLLDEQKAWNQVKEGIVERRRNRSLRMRRWAVAASLMIPLIIGGVYLFRKPHTALIAGVHTVDKGVKLYLSGSGVVNLSKYGSTDSVFQHVKLKIGNGNLSYVPINGTQSRAMNTLVIPATATYQITLSDGTKVSLNSMSRLKFPFAFSGAKREVYLEGEAYFKVAKDADHPFIVHTSLTDIEVLGTEFNVNSYDSSRVKTALVSGSVSASAVGGGHILLKPGYKAVFSRSNGFDVSKFDPNNELSWMQGIYYFQNASLESISGMIYRWYGDTLVFDDRKASESRFTGAMLKDNPLTELLDNMVVTSNIHYYHKDGVIHISAQ